MLISGDTPRRYGHIVADEALKYIANLAKLDLTYKADGAQFTPKK